MVRIAFLCCISFTGTQSFAQGDLAEVRDAVRYGPSSPARSSTNISVTSQADRDCPQSFQPQDPGDNGFGELYSTMFQFAALAPLVIPVAVLEDDWKPLEFNRYPFANGLGSMTSPELGEVGQRFLRRFSVDYGSNFGDINRIAGSVLLDTSDRFGLSASVAHYEERLVDRTDRLTFGTIHGTYRFAQSKHTQFRFGVGLRWLDDQERTRFGFNSLYACDWFVRKPFVISSELHLGNLRESFAVQFRSTVGATFRHAELFVGFDGLFIDRETLPTLIAGATLRF